MQLGVLGVATLWGRRTVLMDRDPRRYETRFKSVGFGFGNRIGFGQRLSFTAFQLKRLGP